jgi:hypothetical protein
MDTCGGHGTRGVCREDGIAMGLLRRIALLWLCCGLLVPCAGCSRAQDTTTGKLTQPRVEEAGSWKNPSVDDGTKTATNGYMDWLERGSESEASVRDYVDSVLGRRINLDEGIRCGAKAVLKTLSARLFSAGLGRAEAGLMPLSALEVAAFLHENKDELQIELILPLQLPDEVSQSVVQIAQEGRKVSSLQTDLRASTGVLTRAQVLYRWLVDDNTCEYPYELNVTLDLDVRALDPAKDFEISVRTRTRTVTFPVTVDQLERQALLL